MPTVAELTEVRAHPAYAEYAALLAARRVRLADAREIVALSGAVASAGREPR